MKYLAWFIFLTWMVPLGLHAEEQPPYEVKDPAISENFRRIYYDLDVLRVAPTGTSTCIYNPAFCVDGVNYQITITQQNSINTLIVQTSSASFDKALIISSTTRAASPGFDYFQGRANDVLNYEVDGNGSVLASSGSFTNDIYTTLLADYSGSSTVVGWASFTTKLIYYKKVGKTVFVYFTLDGTSNATTATFTLPYATSNTVDIWSMTRARDNNVDQASPGALEIDKNTSTANLFKDFTSAVWTNANRKIIQGEFNYQTN